MSLYDDLDNIVSELIKIVDGLQYIIVNEALSNNTIHNKRKQSKYTNKSTAKYDRNKNNPNPKIKIKKIKNVKQPKQKPKKIKEFTCYVDNCGEKFNIWKHARAHFKEKHNIEKPKYKRAKTISDNNLLNTSQNHCLPVIIPIITATDCC